MPNERTTGAKPAPAFEQGHEWRLLEHVGRATLSQHLPPWAVAAIDAAAFAHFVARPPDLSTHDSKKLKRVSAAADELATAIADLDGRLAAGLLRSFESTRPGRWLFRRRFNRSTLLAFLRFRRPWAGLRLLINSNGWLAAAASWEADQVDSARSVRAGRPISKDWKLAAEVGAICAASGVAPSETNSDFMRIMETVWEAAQHPREPTHAIRKMRDNVKDHIAREGRYVVRPQVWAAPVLVMTEGPDGRLQCEPISRGDFFQSELAGAMAERNRQRNESGTPAGNVLAPEKGRTAPD